jgi:ABC-2 type transport system ATP-binding protein
MISVSHLVKRYGSKAAVDDVSFEVGKGDIVGFLGPNGAGKSTTLRILSGFLGMTSGQVTIAGHDIHEDSLEARAAIGYMPEAVPLYPEMRVIEYLLFRAELKGVARKQRAAWVDEAMTRATVMDVANVVIGNLSKGYRQRVGLADALVAKPEILILDEPTAGLDPNQIREVRDLIAELGKSHTILLSTHILSEVEASCTRVLVIAKGRLVASGETKDIGKMRETSAVDLTLRGKADDALRLVRGLPGVAKARRLVGEGEGDVFSLHCTFAGDGDWALVVERAVAALVGRGFAVREIRPRGGSLEDVFAALTRDAGSTSPRDRDRDGDRDRDRDGDRDRDRDGDRDREPDPDPDPPKGAA